MGWTSPGTASAISPKTYSIPLRASTLFGLVGQSRLFAALSRQTSGPLGEGSLASISSALTESSRQSRTEVICPISRKGAAGIRTDAYIWLKCVSAMYQMGHLSRSRQTRRACATALATRSGSSIGRRSHQSGRPWSEAGRASCLFRLWLCCQNIPGATRYASASVTLSDASVTVVANIGSRRIAAMKPDDWFSKASGLGCCRCTRCCRRGDPAAGLRKGRHPANTRICACRFAEGIDLRPSLDPASTLWSTLKRTWKPPGSISRSSIWPGAARIRARCAITMPKEPSVLRGTSRSR